jgi:hypothetical protein
MLVVLSALMLAAYAVTPASEPQNIRLTGTVLSGHAVRWQQPSEQGDPRLTGYAWEAELEGLGFVFDSGTTGKGERSANVALDGLPDPCVVGDYVGSIVFRVRATGPVWVSGPWAEESLYQLTLSCQ